jgi:hypothetical protein
MNTVSAPMLSIDEDSYIGRLARSRAMGASAEVIPDTMTCASTCS